MEKKAKITLIFLASMFILYSVNPVLAISDLFTNSMCDTGNLSTTCFLNHTYFFTDGETINGTGNLIIGTNGSIANYYGANVTIIFKNIENRGNISGDGTKIYTASEYKKEDIQGSNKTETIITTTENTILGINPKNLTISYNNKWMIGTIQMIKIQVSNQLNIYEPKNVLIDFDKENLELESLELNNNEYSANFKILDKAKLGNSPIKITASDESDITVNAEILIIEKAIAPKESETEKKLNLITYAIIGIFVILLVIIVIVLIGIEKK